MFHPNIISSSNIWPRLPKLAFIILIRILKVREVILSSSRPDRAIMEVTMVLIRGT
jgi:hypothetical protein